MKSLRRPKRNGINWTSLIRRTKSGIITNQRRNNGKIIKLKIRKARDTKLQRKTMIRSLMSSKITI